MKSGNLDFLEPSGNLGPVTGLIYLTAGSYRFMGGVGYSCDGQLVSSGQIANSDLSFFFSKSVRGSTDATIIVMDVCLTILEPLATFPDVILVNNQLDAQFFMYVYFYSLHVSGSHVPIIRRIMY